MSNQTKKVLQVSVSYAKAVRVKCQWVQSKMRICNLEIL